MSVTQLSNIVIPEAFTEYVLQNSATKTNLVKSGALVPNAQINTYLGSGSTTFNVPYWMDIVDGPEADLISDDPTQLSVPQKISAYKQLVRKSFLHSSWSTMALSAEIAGSDPLAAIQTRVVEYWNNQLQKRLISSINGVVASNVANNNGDMILEVQDAITAEHTIDACATLGDSYGDLVGVAMHSATYFKLLKNNLIDFLPDSEGKPITSYRGLMVVVDDGLQPTDGVYTTVFFGNGAFGYGLAQPVHSQGTAIEVIESAGMGGGQSILHSRMSLAVHPLGFSWVEGDITADSPSIAELSNATHWKRMTSRKNVPIAVLKHK